MNLKKNELQNSLYVHRRKFVYNKANQLIIEDVVQGGQDIHLALICNFKAKIEVNRSVVTVRIGDKVVKISFDEASKIKEENVEYSDGYCTKKTSKRIYVKFKTNKMITSIIYDK